MALLLIAGCGGSSGTTETTTVTTTQTVSATAPAPGTADEAFDVDLRAQLPGFDGDPAKARAYAKGVAKMIQTISINHLVQIVKTSGGSEMGGTAGWSDSSALTFIAIANSSYGSGEIPANPTGGTS